MKPFLSQRFHERGIAVCRQRVAGLAEIGRENRVIHADLADVLGDTIDPRASAGVRKRAADELDERAEPCGLLRLFDRQQRRGRHAVRRHHAADAEPLPFLEHQQRFLRRHMTACEHEIVFANRGNHRFRLRQQRAILRDAHERRVRFAGPHLILGVERRHPHHAPPPAGHARHVLDRVHIHAADGQVEIDAAEHFDARYRLARQPREPRGRIEVALQHDRAHPLVFREPRGLEAVERPRHVVGMAVHVNVDRTAQVARGIGTGRLWNRLARRRCTDSERHQQRHEHRSHEGSHPSMIF